MSAVGSPRVHVLDFHRRMERQRAPDDPLKLIFINGILPGNRPEGK
jgi:hypothetical protein